MAEKPDEDGRSRRAVERTSANLTRVMTDAEARALGVRRGHSDDIHRLIAERARKMDRKRSEER